MNEEQIQPTEEKQRPSLIIISDFVCPWCYVGHMEVERLMQEYDVEVDFAPFYLHPETPPEGATPRFVTPPEAPPTQMELRGESLGIRFARGRKLSSNSYIALQAAEFAMEYGDPWRFHRRMFQAYFEELEDIGVLENVVRIGADAGLPESDLRSALEEGRYRERVDEGVAWSRKIGVTAIPTFVFNERYGMVGAQELPAFRQILDKIGEKPRDAGS